MFGAAALAAACSGATPQVTTAPGTPTATPTQHPDALVWAVEAAPVTLDAAQITTSASETQIAAQIYDRLVGYRPGSMELTPGLAANWEADVDGLSYTFSLRPGLTFHDGTPLDARAVAWNFARWMDPKDPHRTDFKAWYEHFGAGQPVEGVELPSGLVQRVEALDERSVRITLNAPFAPFVYALASVPFGFASPDAVKAQGEAYGSDGAHLPVGSGPFRVLSWEEDTVQLAPFAGYWAGPPEAPSLRFDVVADAAARLEAVSQGRAHGADLPSDFADEAPLVRLVPRPARTGAWLMLNFGRPPLDDLRVRKAISMALDREALLPHFGRFAEPASQLLPEGFLGHSGAIEAPARNLEMARRLLAEAGADGTFKLNIWAPNVARPYLPDPPGTAQAVADQLKELGLDATVRTEALRQFLNDRERGRFTAWIIGWEAQTADPDNFWFWHFGAGRHGAEGGYNRADLSTLLLNAQRTLGAQSRAAAYEEAAAMVDNDTARVFLAHTRPIVALSPQVEGFLPGPMGFDALHGVHLNRSTPGPDTLPLVTPLGSPGTPGTPGTAAPGEGTAGTPGTDEPGTGTPTPQGG